MTSGPSTIARPACRYLGTTHDAAVHCGYATRENVCYAAARRQSINLEFQETHCLGGPYEECARFQEAQDGATTAASQPAEVVAPVDEPPPARGIAWRPLLLGAAGVIAIALLAFLLLRPAAAPASPSTPTTSPTVMAATPTTLVLVEPTAAPVATNTLAPSPTATQPPAPTAIATIAATSRPTTTATAEATTAATSTATIAATTVITGPYLTTADIVNVREGPGLAYNVLGVLPSSTQWPVQGRNAAGDWVQGCCLAGVPGWITTQFVTVSVAIDDLPIISVPLTPTAGITVTATITP
jgi:uncharacterized protein YraI